MAKCLICQQVKVEPQKPLGLLQPLSILKQKWEHILMGFVVRLPKVKEGYKALWVIIDQQTKSTHFITIKSIQWHKSIGLNICQGNGQTSTIVSDQETRFFSAFWQSMQWPLGMRLAFKTTYHPYIDEQTERVNQVIKDMLKAFCLDRKVS